MEDGKITLLDLIYRPSKVVEKILQNGELTIKIDDCYILKFIRHNNHVNSYTVVRERMNCKKLNKDIKKSHIPVFYIFLTISEANVGKVQAFKKWFDRKIKELMQKGIIAKVNSGRNYMCIDFDFCKEFVKELQEKIENYYNISNYVQLTIHEATVNIATIYQHI